MGILARAGRNRSRTEVVDCIFALRVIRYAKLIKNCKPVPISLSVLHLPSFETHVKLQQRTGVTLHKQKSIASRALLKSRHVTRL